MKQLTNLSILFCILLMVGCRTTKSVQKEETHVANCLHRISHKQIVGIRLLESLKYVKYLQISQFSYRIHQNNS